MSLGHQEIGRKTESEAKSPVICCIWLVEMPIEFCPPAYDATLCSSKKIVYDNNIELAVSAARMDS